VSPRWPLSSARLPFYTARVGTQRRGEPGFDVIWNGKTVLALKKSPLKKGKKVVDKLMYLS
jgi:hypothetical protein